MVVINTIKLLTKLEAFSFICFKDMTRAPNVEMSHITLTTPTWGTVSHHKANNSHGQLNNNNNDHLTAFDPGQPG